MTNNPQKRGVLLLSGGIDSATTGALAKREGYSLCALTIDYGQRHRFELTAAKAVASSLGITNHLILDLDLRAIGGSALTDTIDVPKNALSEPTSGEIPITYVPARNTIFLSLALGWAEALYADTIFIGANAIDFSGYPDCRPEFLAAFERLANLGTRKGIEENSFVIKAPLVNMSKADIIREGIRLKVDYRLTSSCYDPDTSGHACGECDSCILRRRGFIDAGVDDPTQYISKVRA
ncbi:MAG: 7-cyano-7-deazaguanine synthase QueC [candidate division Zixibacteria bacterium]|nr:7-cyano-7-deazaguanine synthase QueC [candidate division Zixibacteria bacterium]